MRVAFYEIECTPPLGCVLCGHYEDIPSQNVLDRLYIKAGVFEDNGEYAAIVAVDTCALPEGIHKVVTDRIAQYVPIPAKSVCISSNHTHSGAPVTPTETLGITEDKAYTDVFLRLVADAVILAYHRLEEAEPKYAFSTVDNISFNRNVITTSGRIASQGRFRNDVKELFDGIDPDLPVLFFEREGKPIGALINFACHQCCLDNYGKLGYSGDYSSILSNKLKEKFGQDFVSLFILGACGDINHFNPDASVPLYEHHYRYMGEVLANSVIASMEKAEKVPGGVKTLFDTIDVPRRPVNTEVVKKYLEKWVPNMTGTMYPTNLLHYNAHYSKDKSDILPVQSILIGDVLISVLPGEIYNALGKEIKAKSPYKRNIIAENCNEYCGYIPTKKAFAENSDLYETSLTRHSCHVPEAGEMIIQKSLELANKI